MKCFCKEQSCQVNKVLVGCWKQIQSHCMYNHVHLGTKLAILIADFIENKQQSDSFSLHTIIKETN